MEYNTKFEQILTTIVVCVVIYLVYCAWIRYAEYEQKAKDAAYAAECARVQAERLAAERTDPLQMIGTVAKLIAITGPVAISLYRNTCYDKETPVPPEVTTAEKVVNGISRFATKLDDLNAQRAKFEAHYGNKHLAPSLNSLAKHFSY
jgi:hypothetical protein